MITLKRADGAIKEVHFLEPMPDSILIHPTQSEKDWWKNLGDKPIAGNVHAPKECFYRFDLNLREKQPWEKRFWNFVKKEMEKFSEGFTVSAYYINPYHAIGGLVPFKGSVL